MTIYRTVRIGDIGDVITGKTPTTNDITNYGDDFMFIGPSDLHKHFIINKSEKMISKKGLNSIKGSILNQLSIMVGCIGWDMGNVALVQKKCATNQQINSITNIKDDYNPYYIYYWLKNKKNFLFQQANVTRTPILNKSDFSNIEISVPNKIYQDRVATCLTSLDKKIELNNRINAELEAMAKTLYDYWFVQFDFPDKDGKSYKSSGGKMVWNEELKREVPEGWEVDCLGDLGNFKNGVNYDPSNPGTIACPIINVRNISASSIFIKNEDLDVIYLNKSDVLKYSVHNGSIIIARSGIPGATRLITDCKENTLYCGFAIHFELINLDKKLPIFFYLKSIEQQIQNGSGGTILKNVNQGTLNALRIVLPKDNAIQIKFNELIEPIFSKINLIEKENQQLSSLRDWLLPMLMNGQVTVGGSKGKKVYEMEEEMRMVAEG